jgi:hypothetical protein
MRLALSSVLLGLSWFAAVNIAGTLAAWLAAHAMARRRCSAGTLLVLRLLPAGLSAFFVGALFMPAHWRFEQPDVDERFGVALSALAGVAGLLLARAAVRAVWILRTDLRFAALTRRLSTPRGTAFEVTGLCGVSLAGILRPRILIGSSALAALTPAELDVAISHEIAHRRSLDNLKRFFISCAPDLFGWLPAARQLEARWEAETECQADASAVSGDNGRAVVLASALVKVARLARSSTLAPSPAWSAFHVPTLLETRVRRLVDGHLAVSRGDRALWLGGVAAAIALPAAVWLLDLSYTLHLVTEAMVTLLP